MTIKIGSLFAGIGGFELGLERSIPNSETIWQVEQDKFCQKILAKHWPNAKIYNDVRDIKKNNVEYVDILCGGFPCQDISIAGKGEGIHDGKKSSLWWEMHRIISELRPRVAVLENVSAITFRGGLDVVASLAQIGYDAEWVIISARDFGAPHKRDRWFCIAYSDGERCEKKDAKCMRFEGQRKGIQSVFISKTHSESEQNATNSDSERCEKEDRESIQSKFERQGIWSMPISTTHSKSKQNATDTNCITSIDTTISQISMEEKINTEQRLSTGGNNSNRFQYSTGTGYWRSPHPEPLIRRVDDGISRKLDSPRLKALGNAIVPQCSEWIGEKIWKSGIL